MTGCEPVGGLMNMDIAHEAIYHTAPSAYPTLEGALWVLSNLDDLSKL